MTTTTKIAHVIRLLEHIDIAHVALTGDVTDAAMNIGRALTLLEFTKDSDDDDRARDVFCHPDPADTRPCSICQPPAAVPAVCPVCDNAPRRLSSTGRALGCPACGRQVPDDDDEEVR